MIAATHIIPRAGVDEDRSRGHGRLNGSGIAHAALSTIDALGEPADLVLIAVPAGRGEELLDAIVLEPGPRRAPSDDYWREVTRPLIR